MRTITYTYNEKMPTNKDVMVAALTNSIDDGGAYYEGVVEYYIDCPYYSDSDCLNEHDGNKVGTAAYSAGCVRCKLSWLNRERGTYPSNDGRWIISEGEKNESSD